MKVRDTVRVKIRVKVRVKVRLGFATFDPPSLTSKLMSPKCSTAASVEYSASGVTPASFRSDSSTLSLSAAPLNAGPGVIAWLVFSLRYELSWVGAPAVRM